MLSPTSNIHVRPWLHIAGRRAGFLTGGPGCGKSFTAQQLIHWGRHNGKRMVLCATTGAAAVRLSAFASTVHSGFAVDSKYGVRDLPLANAVLRAIAYARGA
jgi:hypothetical protein